MYLLFFTFSHIAKTGVHCAPTRCNVALVNHACTRLALYCNILPTAVHCCTLRHVHWRSEKYITGDAMADNQLRAMFTDHLQSVHSAYPGIQLQLLGPRQKDASYRGT